MQTDADSADEALSTVDAGGLVAAEEVDVEAVCRVTHAVEEEDGGRTGDHLEEMELTTTAQSESAPLLHGGFRLQELTSILDIYNWQTALVHGVVSLTYGVLALFFPGVTLAIFTYLFAAYAVVSGARSVYFGLGAMGEQDDRLEALFVVAEGVLCLTAGLWGLVWPGMTAVFMLYIVAAWAVLTGCCEILVGCNFRNDIQWGEVINGFILVVLGAFLYAEPPAEGILTLIWAIGVQGTIGGAILLAVSIWMGYKEVMQRSTQEHTSAVDEERPARS
eukprot:CAMPEP_0198733020 /NCGR_PEP_ID=MMETSP1475-20131203/41910_1 /TAXON_ID= ORGANISM="Unidentified sp., Strain CCMP1999" /NCGR_SAMPLE_ID=MMETSP1475 /ASSEMBLY_ACC=CAM_ASM_001111 /LENGTH=276 /DNA_ID=CAMNT_0044496241 /DNA_START=72 /DNA_END=903 /DNA_ORIENTATION=+